MQDVELSRLLKPPMPVVLLKNAFVTSFAVPHPLRVFGLASVTVAVV